MIPISSLYQWLSHPLILLLVGALISSYLIPALTRRWQEHQKELEIKIDLVDQINEAIIDIVMRIQFVEIEAKSQTQEEFDTAYREWEIKAAVIGSRIRAYLTEDIYLDWDTYSRSVTGFYTLAGIFEEAKRKESLREIQNYFKSLPIILHIKSPTLVLTDVTIRTRLEFVMLSIFSEAIPRLIKNQIPHYDIEWDADILAKRNKSLEYMENFIQLRKDIINQKDSIILDILKSRIL